MSFFKPSMEGKRKIGKVSRLHGYKGELSLKLDPDFIELFSDLDHVYLNLNQKPVPFFIEEVRYTPQGYALVFFDGVDNQNDAEKVRGAEIWMNESDIPDDFFAEDINEYLRGFTVKDLSAGEIGKVASVVEHPGNSFLVIDRDNGEVLIPMHNDIIKEINDRAQLITIEAPEGLIELNLE